MKTINKLVRDRIPEIIRQNGDTAVTYIAPESEFRDALYSKLIEEVTELQMGKNLEEVADLLEVLYELCDLEGWSEEEIEQVRIQKVEKRGAFKKRIILESTS